MQTPSPPCIAIIYASYLHHWIAVTKGVEPSCLSLGLTTPHWPSEPAGCLQAVQFTKLDYMFPCLPAATNYQQQTLLLGEWHKAPAGVQAGTCGPSPSLRKARPTCFYETPHPQHASHSGVINELC